MSPASTPVGDEPQPEEPVFEDIGRGVIDDGTPRGTVDGRGPGSPGFGSPGFDGGGGFDDGGPRAAPGAVREAWRDAWPALGRLRFWFTVLGGLLLAFGGSLLLTLWASADGWFAPGAGSGPGTFFSVPGLLLAAALLALVAAVLGARWGFDSAHPYLAPVLGGVLGAAVRGLIFTVSAGALLLGYGLLVGTPAIVVAAVVVMMFEFLVFGAMGSGARACFAGVLPGGVLAWVVVAALCVGNVAAMVLLLPGTVVEEPASVAANVQRGSDGRYIYYECLGEPTRRESVLHSERVAWLGAMHPSVLFGTMAAGSAPPEIGWVLEAMQWASEGPALDVPCLNGTSSDEIAPSMPVALVGGAGQVGVAAAVAVPGLLRARRRSQRA